MAGQFVSYMVRGFRKDEINRTVQSATDSSEEFNFTENTRERKVFTGNNLNRLDWGAVLAVGLKIRISAKTELYIEARQAFSFLNINRGHWNSQVFEFNNSVPKQLK